MAVWKKLLTAAEATATYVPLVASTLDNLKIDSSGPYINFHDTGETGSAGAGKFRLQSDGDSFLFQTRNDLDNAWASKITIPRSTGIPNFAGAVTVTGVATLGDGSTLATSAAPTADAQIANKLYVDNAISAEDLWDRSSGKLYPANITDIVGIGTNNPQYTLSIENGDVQIFDSANDSNLFFGCGISSNLYFHTSKSCFLCIDK